MGERAALHSMLGGLIACPFGGFFIACNPFVTTCELARPRPPLLSRVGYY